MNLKKPTEVLFPDGMVAIIAEGGSGAFLFLPRSVGSALTAVDQSSAAPPQPVPLPTTPLPAATTPRYLINYRLVCPGNDPLTLGASPPPNGVPAHCYTTIVVTPPMMMTVFTAVAVAASPCESLRKRTVTIRGDITLLRGEETTVSAPDRVVGSGFWLDGAVITARHVVHPLDHVRVCPSEGTDGCLSVTGVRVASAWDVARLQVDQPIAAAQLHGVAEPETGQAVVVAGYPGGSAYMCGGTEIVSTGQSAPVADAFLFRGAIAPGSSGGPIWRSSALPRAVGVVLGRVEVGGEPFHYGAPLVSALTGLGPSTAASEWRRSQPWIEEVHRTLKLNEDTPTAGERVYLAAGTDLGVDAEGAGGLCFRIYSMEAWGRSLLTGRTATPLASGCDSLVYTAGAEADVFVVAQPPSGGAFDGDLRLKRR